MLWPGKLTSFILFKKLGKPRSLFHLFSSFKTHIITIFTTNKCENSEYGARIQTHDLRKMSLLPKPLDQCSRPYFVSSLLCWIIYFPDANRKIGLLVQPTHWLCFYKKRFSVVVLFQKREDGCLGSNKKMNLFGRH